MRSVYAPMILKNAAPCAEWFDGAKIVSYQDIEGTPAEFLFVGWTDAHGSDQHFAQMYMSTDKWVTSTRLTDPPYTGRHNNLVFVNPVDNKIYVCFGDGTDNSYAKDVWRFDWVNGWFEVTSDAGISQMQGYFSGIDDQYAYVGGGYTTISNYLHGIYRASLTDLAAGIGTFTHIGDMPDVMFPNGDGTLLCFKGKLFVYGGGKRNATVPFDINFNIFQSLDCGLTWSSIGSLPSYFFGALWSNFASTGEAVVGVNGSNTENGLYPGYMIISEDGINFRPLPKNVPYTHASAIGAHLQNISTGMGFQRNDMSVSLKLSNDFNV